MKTQPLPPMGQDPSILAGQQTRGTYTANAQDIRRSPSLSDMQAAEQIVALWNAANDTLSSLFEDLQARRQARIDELSTIVPLGPNVPADASAADAAVIQQSFRAALAEARAALPSTPNDGNITPIRQDGTLDAMLADAEKFNDDTLRRAVLTAAYENGHMNLVRRWTDLMGVTSEIAELGELQEAHAGQGMAGQWNYTVFQPLPTPSELGDLERMRAAEQAAADARVLRTVNGTAPQRAFY